MKTPALAASLALTAFLAALLTAPTASAEPAGADAANTAADTPREMDPNWLVREAKTPEGWPDPTPIGEVHVLRLPTYRAAVADANPNEPRGMNGAFGHLFRHIQDRDIPMTAPVEMTFDDAPAGQQANRRPPMTSMAFLYPSTDVGHTGPAEPVKVVDIPAHDVLSIGMRGRMTTERMDTAVAQLQAWLDDNADHWAANGEPRWLGYNSPMVADWAQYAEVQIPLARVSDQAQTAPATQPAE